MLSMTGSRSLSPLSISLLFYGLTSSRRANILELKDDSQYEMQKRKEQDIKEAYLSCACRNLLQYILLNVLLIVM